MKKIIKAVKITNSTNGVKEIVLSPTQSVNGYSISLDKTEIQPKSVEIVSLIIQTKGRKSVDVKDEVTISCHDKSFIFKINTKV